MWHRRALLSTAVLVGLAGVLYLARAIWQPWLDHASVRGEVAGDQHDQPASERVRLSPEARANLRLVVRPLKTQTYWRKLSVPGMIVDRPGVSDRGVTAPVAAVVARVHSFPGDTVKVGDPLFTLRLVSESLLITQAELFKTVQELQLTREQIDRLKGAARGGAVPESKLIELGNQQRRLTAQERSYRQELQARGLASAQIEESAQGRFVKDLTVVAPPPAEKSLLLLDDQGTSTTPLSEGYAYEVQELKVQLGEQVQAGQLLGMLANHRSLFIEGRGFKNESPLLARAAQEGWRIEVEFAEDDATTWPPFDQVLQIRHLSNVVDTTSRTFGFFIPLTNQSRSYTKEGHMFLVWRFRPGQRVRLLVPVEEFANALVLPAGAVVREGPEAFVFRQNGDALDRKPVQVRYEDTRQVVIAGDGSVAPGQHVAQNAAAALNRVLKAQLAGGEGGSDHDQHGH